MRCEAREANAILSRKRRGIAIKETPEAFHDIGCTRCQRIEVGVTVINDAVTPAGERIKWRF